MNRGTGSMSAHATEARPNTSMAARTLRRASLGKSRAKKAVYAGARQYRVRYSMRTRTVQGREGNNRARGFSPVASWRKKKQAQTAANKREERSAGRLKNRARW
ncbi:MAG: hypothetical protein BWY66_00156 [bacterium ADurb.Bin374]|nr:MAG: hypothetical protein BWY66_00156 [bacterium ADurb.Bin374]